MYSSTAYLKNVRNTYVLFATTRVDQIGEFAGFCSGKWFGFSDECLKIETN